MKTILSTGEEEVSLDNRAYQISQGKARMQGSGWTDPRMYQNAIQPGAMISVTGGGSGGSGNLSSAAHRAEQLGLGHLLKNTLNKIKP